jgi:uncharacterized protein (DUF849 family)
MLQATLNGPLTKADHPAVPTSLDELIDDARRCVRAGADCFHIHPRDEDGREQLTADVVDRVSRAVRASCGVPVGVTTGAWIEPDAERRVAKVRRWTAPDYATVNLSESGSNAIMGALLDAGIGIEAGIWTVEDVHRLAASGLAGRVLRVCIEPVDLNAGVAVAFVEDIHHALDRYQIGAPRLQHGDGDATWVLLADAVRRGLATRIGLEDTLSLPDGAPAADNEALVNMAMGMILAGESRTPRNAQLAR